MKRNIPILIAQINPVVGDIESNCQKIIDILVKEQATNRIIVFPELVLTGYPPEDLLLRPAFLQRVDAALAKIAAVTEDCYVIIGYPRSHEGHLFNAAAISHKGECVAHYNKQILPNYGVFDERRYFSAKSHAPTIVTIDDHRFAVLICEDIWEQEPVIAAKAAGADVVLCINASPFEYTKQGKREKLLQQHAENGLGIVYVNMVGGQDELIFDGQSMAFNPQGKMAVRLAAFEEKLQTIIWKGDHFETSIHPLLDTDAQIYRALVLGTRDYIEKNGFPGVLLGLSGGVDSALTLAIAVDALGAGRVHAVMMPSRYTADISHEDAEAEIKALGVSSSMLSIEPAFESLLETLAENFKGLPKDTTEENLQARIRGVLLMALSNKSGKLVLTTSNKSESAVGYATLYGDMAGGLSVLKDVLKTQVYRLCHYRNQLGPVIPERVLTRAPSAELAANQTDQDSLPDYAVLDQIIQAYVEHNASEEAIIATGIAAETVQKTLRLINRNEYKRRQAPIGIKISSRSFGRDWRFPVTCKQ